MDRFDALIAEAGQERGEVKGVLDVMVDHGHALVAQHAVRVVDQLDAEQIVVAAVAIIMKIDIAFEKIEPAYASTRSSP